VYDGYLDDRRADGEHEVEVIVTLDEEAAPVGQVRDDALKKLHHVYLPFAPSAASSSLTVQFASFESISTAPAAAGVPQEEAQAALDHHSSRMTFLMIFY
jgi:hypothetical protein